MTGSEKQQTWATDIRATALKVLGRAYESELTPQQRELYTTAAMEITDSQWWIQRSRDLGTVAKVKRQIWNTMTADQRAALNA